MKNFVIILLVLFGVSCKRVSDREKKTKSSTVETNILSGIASDKIVDILTYDLNFDKTIDSVILMNPPVNDPRSFTKSLFILSEDTISFENPGAWDTLNFPHENNLIKSDLMYLTKDEFYSYVILSGYQYGCCASVLTIISSTNKPTKIFEREFDLKYIGDLDGDGRIEIVGREAFVQFSNYIDSLDADLGSYIPFKVYKLGDYEAEISYELSEQYNKDNYLFTGDINSKDIRVVYPKNGGGPYFLDRKDEYSCNSTILKELSQQLENPTEALLHRFLMTFDLRCEVNIEFSEWSAELLMKILHQHPEELIAVIEKYNDDIDLETIKKELESQTYEYDYKELYQKFSLLKDSDIKLQLLEMIRKSEKRSL